MRTESFLYYTVLCRATVSVQLCASVPGEACVAGFVDLSLMIDMLFSSALLSHCSISREVSAVCSALVCVAVRLHSMHYICASLQTTNFVLDLTEIKLDI